jgi:hypothetical protein
MIMAGVVAAGALAVAGCSHPAATATDDTRPVPPPRPAPVDGAAPGRVLATGAPTSIGDARCGDYLVPVNLSGKREIYPYQLGVQLCSATGWADRTVQVLLPGAGYTASYWSWPDTAHNYVQAATASPSPGKPGAVTAAVSLLGTGPLAAEHPDGAKLTIDAQAWTVHQLISDLRAGVFGFLPGPVVEVGHDVGGMIAWTETAQYGDVAGLVLLDAGHSRQPAAVQAAAAARPAAGDPRFAAASWAGDGYSALPAGSRCRLLYGPYPDRPDRQVCAADERLNAATAIPDGELATTAAAVASTATRQIRVPVLIGVGDADTFLCPHACSADSSPLRSECATWYPAVPHGACGIAFEADAGHVTNLGPHARDLFGKVNTWIRAETAR